MPEGEDAGISRAEFEALRKRVAELEAQVATARPPPPPVAPAPPPPVTPPPRSVGWALLTPPPTAAPTRPVAAAPPRPAPRPAVSLEALLGQRFAPRVGAVLVFLATLFFLGVGIQRGWIGPLAQLGIAAAGAAALLVVAHVLTRRKGYGTYPQVLEATAACVLYATAFVAYAVPYYQRETRLTELGGGLVLALVAAATVGLALWRDARVIAGLGYSLAFLTAGLGWDVLPDLTLPYVALLGTSLAFLVSRKSWFAEAALGSLVTGGFFVFFAVESTTSSGPSPWAVAATAIVPAGAFAWLTLRRVPAGALTATTETLPGLVALTTLAWAVVATISPAYGDEVPLGGALAGWAFAAAALAVAGAPRAHRSIPAAYGVGAVLLYLLAPFFLFEPLTQRDLAVTLAYAVAALALVGAQRAFPKAARPLWNAALAFATAAALHALVVDGRWLSGPNAPALGEWQAWTTFLVLAPVLALLVALAPREAAGTTARAAFLLGAGFLALWGFALFGMPLLTTFYLLAVGALLLAVSARSEGLRMEAVAAGIILIAVAAVKTATFDATGPDDLPWLLAGVETAAAAAALLAVHHLRVIPRGRTDERFTSGALVGGSALVLASYVLAYAEGAWGSILLGALGVAYLVAGFLWSRDAIYRWSGFALLGFVLIRVFLVDLREADLVLRALVFLVLGGILLGVGYVYARMNRARPPPEPVTFQEASR